MMRKCKRVALIGLDGSGKSANIDKMKLDPDYGSYRFLWVRWKPTLLKPAYLLMERSVKHTKSAQNPAQDHGVPQKTSEDQQKLSSQYHVKSGMKEKVFRNPLIRGIWMLLALVDYFVQFHLKTAEAILGGKNVVFDRFSLDLFVDQGINFGYTPEKIGREIQKYSFLFPKVDQMIYLRVSPEVCYSRKNDIPNMAYLLRRYAIYEYLSQGETWCTVDGEEPFDTVYQTIKEKILG